MNEEIQIFNKIFRQLDLNAISSEYLISMEGQICQLENNFDKTLYQTKLKMLKVLHSSKQKITQQQLKQMKNRLALLNSQKKYVIEEGFIHLYIDIYDEKKKAKKSGGQQIGQIISMLLNCLEGLTRYFYLQHQLKQFRKYKNLLKQNIYSNFQGQDEAMQQKIKQRVASKKCSQIFKQYLKQQQANKNKQVCRICYKKIDISQLVNHVDYCGKKTYIKSQLEENFEKRMELVGRFQELTSDLVQRNDLKTLEVVQNIVNFYRKLKKQDRKSKRTSIRYQDTNCPLFFYQHQIYFKGQVKLVNQVSILEDKAFCLSKKLQQIQNHLMQANGDNTNTLKHSLNSNLKLKKYQTISRHLTKNTPKRSTISQSSQNSLSSSNSKQRPHNFSNSHSLSVSNQKQSSKQSRLQQMAQQPQPPLQPPVIVHRRLKKKLTDCQRYSIGAKSDSNASQTNYCSMSIKNFQILKLLGKGAFGRVYLVRRNKTKDIYALKAIKIEKNWGEHQLQLIKNQYGVYKKIAGDHLVAATFSFQEKNVQFFVLQYMSGGDLSTFLEENVYLNESDASFYLAQILLAIQHLHNSQIIHRDLKPQNIVLDQKGHIKLTDFGLSQLRVQNKIMKARDNKVPQQKSPQSPCSPNSPAPIAGPSSNMLKSSKKSVIRNKNDKKLIGTPDYIAPQIIQSKSLANPTIDWWSFGVIAYEMMVGCRPFSARTVEEIFSNICKGDIQWPEIGEKEDQMSRVAADFVGGLLKKNFQERLGFKGVQQIKNHQFFKNIDWKNLKNTTPPLKSPSPTSQKLQLASQNKQLRKQLQSLIDSSPQCQSPQLKQPCLNKLQQLRNYVRYDLLTAQTLQSVRRGTIKKQKRIQKLQSIASNFENFEPWESKYKNAMSSGDDDQGERDGVQKQKEGE